MEIPASANPPKRGDLIQTAMNSAKERTWIILSAKRRRGNRNRWTVWKARWWELEVDMRVRLYRSAQRAGGQTVWYATPQPKKRKPLDFRFK